MPKKIKYRGKVEDKWWFVTPDDNKWQQFWVLINRETVGQYVNIDDINGKEIYEDDIVVTNNVQREDEYSSDEYEGIVSYENDGYCIKQSHSKYKPALCNIYIMDIEVIGNIHDHKTLYIGKDTLVT